MIEAVFVCPITKEEVAYDIASVKQWATTQSEARKVEYHHKDFERGVEIQLPLYVQFLLDSTEKQILDYFVYVIKEKMNCLSESTDVSMNSVSTRPRNIIKTKRKPKLPKKKA